MFPKSRLLSSVLEAQKLKDTFDRRPASWWICSLRFTGGCRDPTCQHKVNGCDSLTAHQSSQMFLIFFSFFLDPIGRRSQIITAASLEKCSAWQPGAARTNVAAWRAEPLRGCCLTGNLAQKFKASRGRWRKGKKEQKSIVCVFVGGLESGISMCAAARSPFSLFTSSVSLPPLHLSRRPTFVPEIAGRETEDAAAHPKKNQRIWQGRRRHCTCLPAEISRDESAHPARWGDIREELFMCSRAFSLIENPDTVKGKLLWKANNKNIKISIENQNYVCQVPSRAWSVI